ncbi:hypothetical protein [Sphingomonas aerolata]
MSVSAAAPLSRAAAMIWSSSSIAAWVRADGVKTGLPKSRNIGQ